MSENENNKNITLKDETASKQGKKSFGRKV